MLSFAALKAIALRAGIQIRMNAVSMSVLADPDRIVRVLTNLLGNAIKSSPPQSTIWVSMEREGSNRSIQVKDRGRGIPTDKLESIFGRFQQVDASDLRQKGGTGLGLAICRHIVRQHGGRIWAESVLNKGSTFYVTLPVAKC